MTTVHLMGAARGSVSGSVADEKVDEARGDGDSRQGILRGGGECMCGGDVHSVVYFRAGAIVGQRTARSLYDNDYVHSLGVGRFRKRKSLKSLVCHGSQSTEGVTARPGPLYCKLLCKHSHCRSVRVKLKYRALYLEQILYYYHSTQ